MRTAWLLLLMAPVLAHAQASTSALESGLRKCAAAADKNARLECFDALVTTIPKVKADEFGMTADIAKKRQSAAVPHPASVVAPQPAETALPGKIVGLREAPRGEKIFTLDNHQIWMQTQAEPGNRFSIGDVVHIEYRSVLGTYWLTADKARKTKVKRVT